MQILIHKKTGKIVLATTAVGTVIELENGNKWLLCQLGGWSAFEIVGDL